MPDLSASSARERLPSAWMSWSSFRSEFPDSFTIVLLSENFSQKHGELRIERKENPSEWTHNSPCKITGRIGR